MKWAKSGNKMWVSDNGMIITNESFTCGGRAVKFFALYKNQAEREKGNNCASADSFKGIKAKAL